MTDLVEKIFNEVVIYDPEIDGDSVRRIVTIALEEAAQVADRQEIMNTQKRPGMGEGRAFSLVQAKIDVARDIAAAIRALKFMRQE
jgi:hypothetical protein